MDGQKMQHKVTQHLLNSCNLSCPVSDNVWVAEKLWLKYCFADSFCQNGTRPWVDRKVFMAKRLEFLAIFENSLTPMDSKVCLFRITLPLAGRIILMLFEENKGSFNL